MAPIMRTIAAIIILSCFSLAVSMEAYAQKRVALVIGNSAYTNISSLSNPKNDADLMAQTLREVGFEVVTVIDADRRTMGRAIRQFGRALRLAGKDAVGLFYFAGHGVQARGTNYLIPVGAVIEDHADLEIESLSASNILTQMESAGNTLNLVILDACRNNPFKGTFRSSERGLSRVAAASGSLVAFAAAPGQVATDGKGKNSPFTSALVDAMRQPGLHVEQVFKRVRVRVERETGGAQTPWEESSLRGNFHFVPGVDNTLKASKPEMPKQSASFDERSIELTFWKSVENTKNVAAFEEYLRRWPNGVFVILARLKIDTLKTETASLATTGDEVVEADTPSDGDPDLRFKLQTALAKTGCNPGKVDGQWGRNSKAALQRFARYAKLTLPNEAISTETLKLLESRDGRVCPLVCGPRQTEKNGRCVAKICPRGQELDNTGQCGQKKTRNSAAPDPTKKPKGQNPQRPKSDASCGMCYSSSARTGPLRRQCGISYRQMAGFGACE